MITPTVAKIDQGALPLDGCLQHQLANAAGALLC
jgi:hypothetical protein